MAHQVNREKAKVVIVGAGPFGVLVAAAAKAAGATKFDAVDLSEVRLKKALEIVAIF